MFLEVSKKKGLQPTIGSVLLEKVLMNQKFLSD